VSRILCRRGSAGRGAIREGFVIVISLKRIVPVAFFVTVLVLTCPAHALPRKGSPAPPFKVVTTAGQKVTGASYRGYVLVMEFFATWCDGCRDSLPHLITLYRNYGKDGLRILGLNLGIGGDGLQQVRQFARENRINFPVSIADADMLLDYGVQPIPAIFVIDRKGVLVEKYVGYNPLIGEALEKTVRTLLAR